MPIVRYDPPKKKGGFLSHVKSLVRFYQNPIGTVLGLATERTPHEYKAAYHAQPIEVNTETGLVSVLPRALPPKARGMKSFYDKSNAQLQASLQEAYSSGVVPLKLPPGYRATAEQIARLQHDTPEVAEAPAPAQDEPAFKQFDYDEGDNMGGFLPPGGLAGFSQMMGASKLALTRGARRVGTGTRRKKRRKKAGRPRRIGRPLRGRGKKKRVARKRAGRARLVKGSAAAKRYMASIRKKRKRG